MATQFPEQYLTAIDKTVELESFTSKYDVGGVEFVNAKTVKVPELTFDGGTNAYSKFSTIGDVELKYTAYELDCDREKSFYIDAVEDVNEAHIRTTNAVSEFERTLLVPEIDKKFFYDVSAKAKTKSTTALTKANIKDELRNARVQLVNNGYARGDLYMTPAMLGCLEDAVDRQFAGEGNITDMVGSYNIFDVYMVPEERLYGLNLAIIGKGGKENPVRHVTKRAVTYLFQPGQHTNGDGWLAQMRWVFGNISRTNQTSGLYVNGTSVDPYKSIDNMTVDELKAFAAIHNIDIGSNTTQANILAAIKTALGIS